MTQDQDSFSFMLSSNNAWACYKAHQNPNFFLEHAKGEAPQILWLGCSDSVCPETTILGLQLGDVVTHRNIANIISATDINTSAAIEDAVTRLEVKHVVLCGHSSCDCVTALLRDTLFGGVLDTWLAPLRAIRDAHRDELNARDEKRGVIRLAELNVQAGVDVLMANHTIQKAIKERGLEVHGCLFDISTGRIRDLGFGTKGRGESVNGSPDDLIRGKHAQLVFGEGNTSMAIR